MNGTKSILLATLDTAKRLILSALQKELVVHGLLADQLQKKIK